MHGFLHFCCFILQGGKYQKSCFVCINYITKNHLLNTINMSFDRVNPTFTVTSDLRGPVFEDCF